MPGGEGGKITSTMKVKKVRNGECAEVDGKVPHYPGEKGGAGREHRV